MQNRIDTFLKQYASIRKRTMKLLEVVASQHLDFAYKEGKFTLADQMRHIGAIERYLYAETIADRPNQYKGCGKDLADGLDNIMAFLDRTHQESMEIFGGLNDSVLQTNCLTPTGYAIKKGKWLELLAEHEIHHRAEIYLYLNLLDVKTPPMYGLTAEEVARL